MYTVMMVCTGNICRSPMAEVVLRARLESEGLSDLVHVESTGISDEESGNPIDPRARQVLEEAGYSDSALYRHSARKITGETFMRSDLILAMTQRHAQALRRIENSTLNSDGSDARAFPSTGDSSTGEKIKMFRAFDPECEANAVSGVFAYEVGLDLSDPWYGGMEDFVECLQQIEAAMDGVVLFVRKSISRR